MHKLLTIADAFLLIGKKIDDFRTKKAKIGLSLQSLISYKRKYSIKFLSVNIGLYLCGKKTISPHDSYNDNILTHAMHLCLLWMFCFPDINECLLHPRICGEPAKCVNTPGMYECQCPDGFDYNFTSKTCDGRFEVIVSSTNGWRRRLKASSLKFFFSFFYHLFQMWTSARWICAVGSV